MSHLKQSKPAPLALQRQVEDDHHQESPEMPGMQPPAFDLEASDTESPQAPVAQLREKDPDKGMEPLSKLSPVGYETEKEEKNTAAQLKSASPPAFQLKASDLSSGPKTAGGLPIQLKERMEAISGESMDDVNVEYNSDKPAQLKALGVAKGGNTIQLARGAEEHLPHEAGHIIQQKKGEVKATTEVNGQAVNDDKAMEAGADNYAAQAMKGTTAAPTQLKKSSGGKGVAQLQRKKGAKMPGVPEIRSLFVNAVKDKFKTIAINSGKMKKVGNSFGQGIYGGKQGQLKGKRKMTHYEKVARHLATILLALDGKREEVQVGVSLSKKKLAIACNKSSLSKYHGMTLDQILGNWESNQKMNDTLTKEKSRRGRHYRQLQSFFERSVFKDFKIIVSDEGTSGQHAETKLLAKYGHKNFDYIGGTRRPCLACYVFMHMNGVSQDKFNSHHGPLWDTQNAYKAFAEVMIPQFQSRWNSNKTEDENQVVAAIMNNYNWNHAANQVGNLFHITGSTYDRWNRKHTQQTFDYDTESDTGYLPDHKMDPWVPYPSSTGLAVPKGQKTRKKDIMKLRKQKEAKEKLKRESDEKKKKEWTIIRKNLYTSVGTDRLALKLKLKSLKTELVYPGVGTTFIPLSKSGFVKKYRDQKRGYVIKADGNSIWAVEFSTGKPVVKKYGYGGLRALVNIKSKLDKPGR